MRDRFSAAEGGDGAEQRPHAHHVESATEQGWVMLSLSLYTRMGFLKLPTMQAGRSLDVERHANDTILFVSPVGHFHLTHNPC